MDACTQSSAVGVIRGPAVTVQVLSASAQNSPRNSYSSSSQVIVHILIDILVLTSAYRAYEEV